MDLRRFKTYDHEDKLQNDIHFTIDHNGNWYFHGSQNPGPMKREALVKLFADKALKYEDGKYFLKTPFESYEVDVEDVPFLILGFEEREGGIFLISNIGETVRLDEDHKLFLQVPPFSDLHLPYIQLDSGMVARLSPEVRDNFIDMALQQDSQDIQDKDALYLQLNGVDHPLGLWEDE